MSAKNWSSLCNDLFYKRVEILLFRQGKYQTSPQKVVAEKSDDRRNEFAPERSLQPYGQSFGQRYIDPPHDQQCCYICNQFAGGVPAGFVAEKYGYAHKIVCCRTDHISRCCCPVKIHLAAVQKNGERSKVYQCCRCSDKKVDYQLHGYRGVACTVVHDAVKSSQTIFPADFFAFFKSPGIVAYGTAV